MTLIRILAAGLLTAITLPALASPNIGNLVDFAAKSNPSCGLFLQDKQDRLTFFADVDMDGFVNVDGTVITVHHMKTENHQQTPGRVTSGDTFSSVFATAGTEVKLELKVVKGCESVGSVCPNVTETGTLQLSNSLGKTVIDVHGGERCADKQ